MSSLQSRYSRVLWSLFRPDYIWMFLVVGNIIFGLSDKYVPEFNDKQAFEISWLSSDPAVSKI